MDAHAREAAAAAEAMAELYGTDSPSLSAAAAGVQKPEPGTATVQAGDSVPLAAGMAVKGAGWWGTVEWCDGDRVTVCVDRRAWIAYHRRDVRRAGT